MFEWFVVFSWLQKDIESNDEDRGNISIEKVNECIDAVVNAFHKIKKLRLILNMDECVFVFFIKNTKSNQLVFYKLYSVQKQTFITYLGFAA